MEHDTKKKYFSKIIDHDKFILFITLFIFKYRKQSQKKDFMRINFASIMFCFKETMSLIWRLKCILRMNRET